MREGCNRLRTCEILCELRQSRNHLELFFFLLLLYVPDPSLNNFDDFLHLGWLDIVGAIQCHCTVIAIDQLAVYQARKILTSRLIPRREILTGKRPFKWIEIDTVVASTLSKGKRSRCLKKALDQSPPSAPFPEVLVTDSGRPSNRERG